MRAHFDVQTPLASRSPYVGWKRIGILGGIGPTSTMIYYQHITHEYARIYRNLAYPEIVIYSLSFREVADWLNEGRWQLVTQKTTEALKALQNAGADFGLIACNYFTHSLQRILGRRVRFH